MVRNRKFTFTAILFLASIIVSNNSATASTRLFHGTSCSSVNDTQNQFLNKNGDGVLNTHATRLFVICPINIDITDSDFAAIFDINVSMILPPSYGTVDVVEIRESLTTGPKCGFRAGGIFIYEPGASGPISATTRYINVTGIDLSTIVAHRSGFFATGNARSLPTAGISELSSAHLICLIPAGGTLAQYSVSKI